MPLEEKLPGLGTPSLALRFYPSQISYHLGKERKWNPRWAALQPAATWTVANVVVLEPKACCYTWGPSVFCGSVTIWLLVWAKTVLPQPRCIWEHLSFLEQSLWFLALRSCPCPFLSRKISTYQMSFKILLQPRFSSNAIMKSILQFPPALLKWSFSPLSHFFMAFIIPRPLVFLEVI